MTVVSYRNVSDGEHNGDDHLYMVSDSSNNDDSDIDLDQHSLEPYKWHSILQSLQKSELHHTDK